MMLLWHRSRILHLVLQIFLTMPQGADPRINPKSAEEMEILLERRRLAAEREDAAEDLMRLRDQHPQTVLIKELDVTRFETFPGFVEDIKVSA